MDLPVERADSSAVCMRGVAAALRERFLDPFEIPLIHRWGLSLIAPFGQRAVRRAVGWGVRFRGADPAWAGRVTAGGLARQVVSLYNGLEGPFDAVLIGAPNGGVAHLAAALGAPFLSQHFLFSFRDPTDPDDIRTYFDHGTTLARRILRREPMVAIEALRGAPGGWALEGVLLENRPESEWGTEPPLREVVETFAHRHGYRFLPLEGDHPEWYARLAWEAHRRLSEREGREPAGTLIEVFTQSNPVAPPTARLLPLWLPFNCADSLRFLRRMREELPADRPVLFTPLSNFVHTFDTVEWETYREVLSGLDLRVLGVRERLFPSDPAGLWRPAQVLARWCAGHPDPVTTRLGPEELSVLVQTDS